MTRAERLREQYEDRFFALWMDQAASVKGRELLEENARLRNDPTKAVPLEIERACLQTIHQAARNQNQRKTKKRITRILRGTAIAACTVILLFTMAFAVSAKFRVNTLNYLIEHHDGFTKYLFAGNRGQEVYSDQTGAPMLSITWLPDGFTLVQEEKNFTRTLKTSQNQSGARITVFASSGGTTLVQDTENGTEKTVEINGYQATLHVDGGMCTLTWYAENEGVLISITTDGVSVEDLLRFAEHVVVK